MNINNLKQHLIENLEYVQDVLECYFYNIKYFESSNQFRFSHDEEDNTNPIKLSCNTLYYKDYKMNKSGDFLSLIMDKLGVNLGKCINIISAKACYFDTEDTKHLLAFGGYYKNKQQSQSTNVGYDNDIINKYPKTISKMFLRDGISVETQSKFNIRYDCENGRVVIPCYQYGKLIGAIGRYNKVDSGDIPKYLPILPYNKSSYIFGVDVNYNYIHNDVVIVIESEKSVLKAYTRGVRNVVAIGGNSITELHRQQLYTLNPTEIVVMFDKGLDKRRIEEMGVNLQLGLEEAITNRLKVLQSKNTYYSPIISYINLNEFSEIEDKNNVFDYDNLDFNYYLNKRKEYNG